MSEQDTKLPKGYNRGKWAGKIVTLRKPHFDAMLAWAKQSGMSKASFFRAALMRGALEMARDIGIEARYPELEE